MNPAELQESVAFLKSKTSDRATPTVGVICGSGLSGLSKCLSNGLTVNYEEIPGFPQTTIEGHKGELVFGSVDDVSVVLMRGRFHSYEGHPMEKVTAPVKIMRGLGVETLIVTNAAGGINRSFSVGDLMIIDDHIGFPLLAGKHPLVGLNDDTFGGPRFLPTSDAYDAALRQLVYETAQPLGMGGFLRRTGTYAMVSGPTYESAGESRMLMRMGADAVGMSTVPEVVVARHCGMKVLGLSLITNAVILPGDVGAAASHEEVLETVVLRGEQIQELVRAVIAKLGKETYSKIEERLLAAAEGHALAGVQREKAPSSSCLKERIAKLDVSNMTPLEALKELAELKSLSK